MPKIDFSFQGWVRGVNVSEAKTSRGNVVDVSNMDAETLCKRLNKDLYLSLSDLLHEGESEEIHLFDFETLI